MSYQQQIVGDYFLLVCPVDQRVLVIYILTCNNAPWQNG